MGTVRGPYANGVERRQQIIDAAFAVFARRGYAKTSLKQIADAVGVTPANLLWHFQTKEGLLLAVLSRWDGETQFDADHPRPCDGFAYLQQFPHVIARHREHPGIVELLLTLCTEVSDPTHPARAWVSERYARIMVDTSEALRIAAEQGEVAPMDPQRRVIESRMIFAIMDGLELQWIADPSMDLGEMFLPMWQAMLQRWRAE
jgi:AcrR family transcriptional regulator